jgi:hypothetical protein
LRQGDKAKHRNEQNRDSEVLVYENAKQNQQRDGCKNPYPKQHIVPSPDFRLVKLAYGQPYDQSEKIQERNESCGTGKDIHLVDADLLGPDPECLIKIEIAGTDYNVEENQ